MIVRAVRDDLGVLVGQQLRSEFLYAFRWDVQGSGDALRGSSSGASVSITVTCFCSSLDFRFLVEIVLSILISLRMTFSMPREVGSILYITSSDSVARIDPS